jgi:hypothetical protein
LRHPKSMAMNDISAFSTSNVRTVMIVCVRQSRSARSLGGPTAATCAASWPCVCGASLCAFSNTAKGR